MCSYIEPFVKGWRKKEVALRDVGRTDFQCSTVCCKSNAPNGLSIQKINYCQQCSESNLNCSSIREANVPLGGIACSGKVCLVVLSQAGFNTAAL